MFKNKLTTGLMACALVVSTAVPFVSVQADSAVVKLAGQFTDRVSTGGLQTVSVKLLDASGNVVSTAQDEIALKVTHTGLVRVFDSQGNLLTADSLTGQYVVPASSGVATFEVSDASAETVLYSFTDVTDQAVTSSGSRGTFATVSKYVFHNSPISIPNTLNAGDTRHVTLTAVDSTGAGVGNANIFLSFVPGNDAEDSSATFVLPDQSTATLSATPTQYTTDRNGQITITYQAPSALPNGGSDKIVAQDTRYSPRLNTSDSYTFGTFSKIKGTSTLIAPTGSLGANKTVDSLFSLLDAKNLPIGNATVYMSLKPSATGATVQANGVTLSTDLQAVTTDSSGKVDVSYTTPTTLPNGGTDTVTVYDSLAKPKQLGAVTYTYAKVNRYVMGPTTIAAAGSLKANQSATFAVNVIDSSGNHMSNGPVYLSLSHATGSTSTASVNTTVNGVPTTVALTNTPQLFYADAYGQVNVTYQAPGILPSGGADAVVAQDDPNKPHVKSSNQYAFDTVANFDFAYPKGFTVGSLDAQGSTTITMTAQDRLGRPLANTQVYLSLTNPAANGGTATVTEGTLSATPLACVTNNLGQIVITYTAADTITSGAVDTIKAFDGGRYSKSTTYTYRNFTRWVVSPSSIPTGSLGAGETTPIAFTPTDAAGNVFPHTYVYVSMNHLAGNVGGTATANGVPLGTGLTKVETNYDGQVIVSYTTPAELPSGGTESFTVQDLSGRYHSTLSYTYAQVAHIVFNGTTIAPTGTLPAGTTQDVTATAYDAKGNPLVNTVLYVKFVQANGGGSTTVGLNQDPVGSDYQQVVTGADGTISFTYTTPDTLPTSGYDQIVVTDLLKYAHATNTDKYTF